MKTIISTLEWKFSNFQIKCPLEWNDFCSRYYKLITEYNIQHPWWSSKSLDPFFHIISLNKESLEFNNGSTTKKYYKTDTFEFQLIDESQFTRINHDELLNSTNIQNLIKTIFDIDISKTTINFKTMFKEYQKNKDSIVINKEKDCKESTWLSLVGQLDNVNL